MAKSSQKRKKLGTGKRTDGAKTGDSGNGYHSNGSEDKVPMTIPVRYVIVIGLMCAVTGAMLYPHLRTMTWSLQGSVQDEKRSVPQDKRHSVPQDQVEKRSEPHDDNHSRPQGDVQEQGQLPSTNASSSEHVLKGDGDHTEENNIKILGEDNSEKIKPVDEQTLVDMQSQTEPGKTQQSKSVQKTKDEKSKKKGKTEVSKKNKLPKEVLDFKPTFLKELKPKKIFADGRRIPPIELLPQKPNNSSVRVYLFDDFLSTAECDGLRRAHDRHVNEVNKLDPIICFDSISTMRRHLKDAKKSKVKVSVNDFTDGTRCLNASFSSQFQTWLKSNWSLSTSFYPGESKFSSIYEQRAKEATGLTQENGGKFQITSYPLGIGYKTHTDCIVGNPDKRDRFATMLVYLETVEKGGETAFPELGIWVKPKKGRALVWNNMNSDGECEPLSIHTAAKVEIGSKYILQRWFYYKSFYSLGKRPQEPRLPLREEFQPRVNCDEYDNGSCRWYDEWGYDHLLDYERQKLTLI